MKVRGSNKMKLITEIIEGSKLKRTLYSNIEFNLDAIASTILISYEYK